jgi:hypothetical protein
MKWMPNLTIGSLTKVFMVIDFIIIETQNLVKKSPQN